MFTHVMVPLDGSQSAEVALPVAAALAKTFQASVTLVHLIEEDSPTKIHGEQHLQSAAAAEEYLAEAARSRLPAGVPVATHVHTVAIDDVAQSLAAHAIELRADVIVMCIHGKRGLSETVFGSLAEKSLAEGRVPVLMVRPSQTRPFHCRSILVPLDGKPSHLPALQVAGDLARAFEARLDLLTVVPTFSSLADGEAAVSRLLPSATRRVLELSVQEARAFLAGHRADLAEQGLTAESRVLRGDPARAILKSARTAKSDLIVLTTHGRAGLRAFWAGSVGSPICAAATSPVLLIPEANEASESGAVG